MHADRFGHVLMTMEAVSALSLSAILSSLLEITAYVVVPLARSSPAGTTTTLAWSVIPSVFLAVLLDRLLHRGGTVTYCDR